MIIQLIYLLAVLGLTAYSLWYSNPQRTFWKLVTPVFLLIPVYFDAIVFSTLPPFTFIMFSLTLMVLYTLYTYGNFQYHWDWIDTFLVATIIWEGIGAAIKDSWQYAILTLLQGVFDQFIPYLLIRLLLKKEQVLRTVYYLVIGISVLALISPLEFLFDLNIPLLIQQIWPEHVIPNSFIRGGFVRVASTFGHPIHAGIMFSFALFSSFALFQMKVFTQRWQLVLLAVLNALAIYMTISRTSYFLAVPILALIYFTFVKRRVLYGLLLVTAAIGVLTVAVPAMEAYSKNVGAGATEEQTSAAYRAGLFDAYVPEILSEPIFGHGFWIPSVGTFNSIDNHYLFILLRWGIPGLFFFCLPFLIAFVRALFYYARSHSSREQGMLWTLISIMVYYAIVAQTVWLAGTVLIFWFMILGLFQVMMKEDTKPQVLVSHAFPRWM